MDRAAGGRPTPPQCCCSLPWQQGWQSQQWSTQLTSSPLAYGTSQVGGCQGRCSLQAGMPQGQRPLVLAVVCTACQLSSQIGVCCAELPPVCLLQWWMGWVCCTATPGSARQRRWQQRARKRFTRAVPRTSCAWAPTLCSPSCYWTVRSVRWACTLPSSSRTSLLQKRPDLPSRRSKLQHCVLQISAINALSANASWCHSTPTFQH